jgi:hypothetical protein
MKVTKYVVITYKFGNGDTPSREFIDYDEALEYFESQKDEIWHSVEMRKVETELVQYFACVEECETSRTVSKK